MLTDSAVLLRMAPLSDGELVARILVRDTAAMELLMRRHNQRLFRLARAIVRSDDEAEDVVQEAYVRAYTNLSGFEGRSSVATWLSRITLHEALRRRRRRRAASLAGVEGPAAAGAAGESMDRERTREMLTRALDSLPAGLRAVVMLRSVEGLDTKETAASLGLSEENVRVSLHRGRRMLMGVIEQGAVEGLRGEFGCAGARCDRIVSGVFERLGRGE